MRGGNNSKSIRLSPKTYGAKLKKDLKVNFDLYLMILPILAFFIIFCYVPLYGLAMAFYDYVPALGFSGSEFIAFENFTMFFDSMFFGRLIRNTVVLNILDIIFVFPAPIIFALLLFEIKYKKIVKAAQFLAYIPYFISLVVVCGIIKDFSDYNGLFSNILAVFGIPKDNLLNNPDWYFPLYLGSNIWQIMGFSSVLFFAALCSVDTELFDAAKIDGAGRIRQLFKITLPSIMPTITIMFIIRMGGILNVGFEKSYLLKNPLNSQVSDVISTYVYEKGFTNWGYGTAVGLFSAVINFAFLFVTNMIARRTENSLW